MNIFHDNTQKYSAKILNLGEDLNRLSILRLTTFMVFTTIIVVMANGRLVLPLFLVVPVAIFAFGLVIRRYNRVAYQKRHTTFLRDINEQEIRRLEMRLADFPEEQKPIDQDHPYIADLDIFGEHSLFKLLNRATTESGKDLLTAWLAQRASNNEILERQEAVKELSPEIDWRQDFQALGMHAEQLESDYKKLISWVARQEQLLPHRLKYSLICVPLSLLSTGALFSFFNHLVDTVLNSVAFSWAYFVFLIFSLFLNALVLRRVKPIADEIIEGTLHNLKILDGYQSLIKKIESKKFNAPLLKQVQSLLTAEHYSASAEIYRLKKILEVFHQRGIKKEAMSSSFFYALFNIFWLLDFHLIILTEKWKSKNRAYFKDWAFSVSNFEVLSSFGGFSYSNPSYSFPEIKEDPYIINFEMLGHPLLAPDRRVCNNFQLDGQGEVAMVTGSNMAGKSTFLRTVGINLVLALTGAPCCARSAQVSNMQIFTSMRTQDNLGEGVSSFYAELKRIEQLLKLIKSGQSIFFLLDEMFKGTNSQDRYKGGVSLIKQISELNAFGMISTHDLELAILSDQYHAVTNYSFNSKIIQGEMVFDYQLTNDICQDFNASELMKKSGINILPDTALKRKTGSEGS